MQTTSTTRERPIRPTSAELRRPRVLFLGIGYAGHRTRFEALRQNTAGDPRIDATYRLVTGWEEGGLLERLPFPTRGVRGRVRSSLQAASFLRVPRPDVIWTSAQTALRAWIPAFAGPMRRPLIVDKDCAPAVRQEWARVYWGREPHRGARLALHQRLDRRLAAAVTLWTPWSEWAAASMVENGIDPRRIEVLPPGVDLDRWSPPDGGRRAPSDTVRLLFVGGDFERKGGELLLDVLASGRGERFELDIVTRDPVPERPGVRVHRAEPGSPLLHSLFDRADLFVMPSLAECFGIATVEAMASGLPVLVGNTGAGPEIVGPDAGWCIPPDAGALAAALDAAWECRHLLPAIGERARCRAVQRFDGPANDRRVVGLALEIFERSSGTRGQRRVDGDLRP